MAAGRLGKLMEALTLQTRARAALFKFCPMCADPLHPTPHPNNKTLPSCIKCNFTFYNNPVPVVAAIVEHEDEGGVVLARNVAWPAGRFGLITGFLETEEDPAQAVLREVKEELDLDAKLGTGLIGVYPFSPKNELVIAYHCTARGKITLDTSELAEVKIVPPKELVPWPMGTGLAVRDWLISRNITHNLGRNIYEEDFTKPKL